MSRDFAHTQKLSINGVFLSDLSAQVLTCYE